MLHKFYSWITYNPYNINIKSVLPKIIIVYIVIVLLLCMFVVMFRRITIKTIILSLICAPYCMISILWEICFTTETIFIGLIPIYPLIILLSVRYGIKYIRKRY